MVCPLQPNSLKSLQDDQFCSHVRCIPMYLNQSSKIIKREWKSCPWEWHFEFYKHNVSETGSVSIIMCKERKVRTDHWTSGRVCPFNGTNFSTNLSSIKPDDKNIFSLHSTLVRTFPLLNLMTGTCSVWANLINNISSLKPADRNRFSLAPT
jgi:hypothetical protein